MKPFIPFPFPLPFLQFFPLLIPLLQQVLFLLPDFPRLLFAADADGFALHGDVVRFPRACAAHGEPGLAAGFAAQLRGHAAGRLRGRCDE